MLRCDGVCCIDVGDVQRCSVRQVEAAVGVEAIGRATLDGVEGEVSPLLLLFLGSPSNADGARNGYGSVNPHNE